MQRSQKRGIHCLPDIRDSKFLITEVTRLIKNKIQPLSYKHYILKSGNFIQKFEKSNNQKDKNQNIHSVSLKKSKENSGHKDNCKINKLDKNKNKRRKALIQISSAFNRKDYHELQSKVQQHIILKRMDLMEDQYAYAQQCNKIDKQKMCNKLRRSPLSKYLGIFQKSELPSQKIKRIDETSCEQMIKQIKSAKTIKHIQYMEDNVRSLWNQDKKSLSEKQKNKENVIKIHKKIGNKKLKKEIMTDIRKQYHNQASSKIRISINHRKMIQIV